jgi:predicted DNA-binding protein
MTDEKPKKPKKGGRMVTAPVRLTEETHQRVKTLSEMWDVTISEAIDLIITEHVPEIDEEIRRRGEKKRAFGKKKPNVN